MQQVHGKRYQYGEGALAFYPASGGSDDWSHNKAKIDLSFTIELRDTGTYAFLLPENQLIPNGEENMEGIRAVIDHIRCVMFQFFRYFTVLSVTDLTTLFAIRATRTPSAFIMATIIS